jgi:hypothetical protein
MTTIMFNRRRAIHAVADEAGGTSALAHPEVNTRQLVYGQTSI